MKIVLTMQTPWSQLRHSQSVWTILGEPQNISVEYIHPFNKHLLSPFYGLGTILGIKSKAVSQIGKYPDLLELDSISVLK